MASAQECEQALHDLAARLAGNDPSRRKVGLDRTLSCSVKDLGVVFAGRLKDGDLIEIAAVPTANAQVRLTMSSDDLVALVHGKLKMASAWATGRVKVDGSVRDILKLRSLF